MALQSIPQGKAKGEEITHKRGGVLVFSTPPALRRNRRGQREQMVRAIFASGQTGVGW